MGTRSRPIGILFLLGLCGAIAQAPIFSQGLEESPAEAPEATEEPTAEKGLPEEETEEAPREQKAEEEEPDGAVFLETDADARKLLGEVADPSLGDDWRKKTELLMSLLENHPGSLGPKGNDPALFVPAPFYVAEQILGLPEEGFRNYLREQDAAASAAYLSYQKSGKLEELLAVVEKFLPSRVGPGAADALAQRLFERGRMAEAAFLWKGILAVFPQELFDRVGLLTKLALAYLALGRESEFQKLLVTLRQEYPVGKVSFAGESTGAVAFLSERSAEHRGDPIAGAAATSGPGPEMLCRGRRVWEYDLGDRFLPDAQRGLFRERGRRVPLAIKPTVLPDAVVVTHLGGVISIDRETGETNWEVYEPDLEPKRYDQLEDAQTTAALHGDLLCVKLGKRLRGYDLTSGALLWDTQDTLALTADQEFFRDLSYFTSPVSAGGLFVIAATREKGEVESLLAAFDAETGKLAWKRLFAAKGRERLLGIGDRPSRPRYLDGTLYHCSNLGAVGAIDAESGKARWVRKYDAFVPRMKARTVRDRRRWDNATPLLRNGILYVVPQDANYLYALDVVDGTIAWQIERDRHTLVHGINGEQLLLSGKTLAAVDRLTGALLWERTDLGHEIVGPGLFRASEALLPTRDGLWRIRAANGEELAFYPAQDLPAPAGLTLDGKCLLVYGPTEARRFDLRPVPGEGAGRTTGPQSPLTAGATDGAAMGILEHLNRPPHDTGVVPEKEDLSAIRGALLCAATMGAARNAREGNASRAGALHRILAGLCPPTEGGISSLLAATRTASARSDWPGAVAAWQQMIEWFGRDFHEFEGGPAVSVRSYAARQIGAVRQKAGDEPYRAFEETEREVGPGLGKEEETGLGEAGLRLPLQLGWQTYSKMGAGLATFPELAAMDSSALAGRFLLLGRSDLGGFGFRVGGDRRYERLTCHEVDSGAEVWSKHFPEGLSAEGALGLSGGLIIAATRSLVAGIHPVSGETQWVFAAKSAPPENKKEEETDPGEFFDEPDLLRPRPKIEPHRVSSLVVEKNRSFVVTRGGSAYCLNSETGSVLWQKTVEGTPSRLVLVGKEKVLLVTQGPLRTYLLDREDGALLFMKEFQEGEGRLVLEPQWLARSGILFLALPNQTLRAYQLEKNQVLWEKQFAFDFREIVVFEQHGLVAVFPPSWGHAGQAMVLDAETGQEKWRESGEKKRLRKMVVLGDRVYLVKTDGPDVSLHACELPSFKELWAAPLPKFPSEYVKVARAGRYVLVSSEKTPRAQIYAAETGELLREFEFPGRNAMDLAVRDGVLCFATDRGTFGFESVAEGRLEQEILDAGEALARDGGNEEYLKRLAALYFKAGKGDYAIRRLADALNAEGLSGRGFRVLHDQLSGMLEHKYQRRRPKMALHKFQSQPEIDGELADEWREEQSVELTDARYISRIQEGGETLRFWRGRNDLSARLYLGWDDDHLYLAVDVTDDIARAFSSESPTWKGDGLTIAIDPDLDGGIGMRAMARDYVFTQALMNKKPDRDEEEGDEPEGQYAVRRKSDGTGTIYESAIPWSYIDRVVPAPGSRFGFNIYVTDDDSGDGAEKGVTWAGGIQLHRNRFFFEKGYVADYFGEITLSE